MRTLKDFYSEFNKLIKKELVFFNLSQEEIEQECALVWFENKMIESLYLEGNRNQAFAVFRKALRRSSSSFSLTNKVGDYRMQKESERKAFAKIVIDNKDIDSCIYNNIIIGQIKNFLNSEDYEYIMNYYTYGMKSTAKKYEISESNTRVKALRIIKKVKEGMRL
ncbi:MAG: hypothetical protein RR744_00270 [Cellulosilyticaceae bacterium]